MSEHVNDGKRGFLKTAMLGAGASAVGAAAPGVALAQMLETNIREDSVLAKIRKEGVINVGYAQTGPWFYKDAKTGELGGIYKDVVDMLAKEIQIKVEWKEVTFANSTVALRRGDYDLFGSSLVYLVQRALVVNYVGPLYSKGVLFLIHKDNADRFKSGKLVAVAADTLPSELQLLKEGYVAALVGQRPFEMGEKSMDTLLALHDGKPVQEIIYTGVDRVTKDNVGEFLK